MKKTHTYRLGVHCPPSLSSLLLLLLLLLLLSSWSVPPLSLVVVASCGWSCDVGILLHCGGSWYWHGSVLFDDSDGGQSGVSGGAVVVVVVSDGQ
jgi:hypothetical protein